jgi:signal transduction histidine kinase
MKLVPKLTLVFAGAISLMLVARDWYRIRRDSDLVDSDMRRDHRVLITALRSSLAEVHRLEGTERAKQLVAAASGRDGAPQLRWIPRLADVRTVSEDDRSHLEQGQVVSVTEPSDGEYDDLVTLAQVVRDDPADGVLEVRESLRERDAYLRRDIRSALLSVAFLLVLVSISSALMSRWIVGDPIRALVRKARDIGEGDFKSPLALLSRDELGDLAKEVNAMCDRLRLAHDTLEKETAGRIEALEQLRHADRLATVGKLAAGLAHELGTPLAVMVGHAQMISHGEVTGDRVAQSANVIEEQASRIGKILKQLLDFARRRGPHGESADAVAVARQCVSWLEPVADKRHVALRLESAPEELRVAMDAEAVIQVVTNLVMNALAATPPSGHVGVAIEQALTREEERQPLRSYARISVEDDGHGIADDVLPHIFEPFFTTKESGEGTGLGLSVVYGLVKDHEGFVRVTTKHGQGSMFAVHLPLVTESRS